MGGWVNMTDTLKEIRERVEDELDLIEQEYLDKTKLDNFINYAVRKAHREIVKLYEDYFLSSVDIAVSSTQNSIDYPVDVFANKIRKLMFTDAPVGSKGQLVYEIKSSRNLAKDAGYNMLATASQNGYYQRWIPYSSLSEKNMQLVPDSATEGHVRVWYIRRANVLSNDDDICDIPEFVDYVVQVAKSKYYLEDSDPRYTEEKNEERALKKDLINTLTNMKPDENTEVQQDFSFYEDSI